MPTAHHRTTLAYFVPLREVCARSSRTKSARHAVSKTSSFSEISSRLFLYTLQFYQNLPSALFARTTNKPFLTPFFGPSPRTLTHTLHTSHVAHVHHVGTPVQAILRFVEAVAPRCYDCPRRRQQPAGPGAAADQVEVEVAARRGQAVHGQRPLRRLDAEGLVGECTVETGTLYVFFSYTQPALGMGFLLDQACYVLRLMAYLLKSGLGF